MVNVGWTDDDNGGESASGADSDAEMADGLDADLYLAGLRSSQAAERLRRDNREAQRRREWATLSSMLAGSVDLSVVIHTLDRSTHSGKVVEVGGDYVAIESTNGIRWIALDAVCAVESPAEKPVDVEAAEGRQSILVDVIDDLIAAEAILNVTLVSGATLHGEATAVGASLFLRSPSHRGSTSVRVDAIAIIQITHA